MAALKTHSLNGRRVLVVGLGRSGVSAARFCAAEGARVTVNDHRTSETLAPALGQLPPGVETVLGSHPEAPFLASDLIVVSPGVPPLPAMSAAMQAGVEIIGEIELAVRYLQSELICVTGTNGKSTTTSWIGDMLSQLDRPLFVGGNLGQPLVEAVGTPAAGPGGICVAELSSFQLETVSTLKPRVALLLNLTEDHLDRYPDMAAYGAAKRRIFSAQSADDWAVVNWDQPGCRDLAQGAAAQVVGFSSRIRDFHAPEAPRVGALVTEESLEIRLPGRDPMRLDTTGVKLVGRHNLENGAAAALAAVILGAPAEHVLRALETFGGLPHRMQAVGEVNGVRFFNDSKATNVSAVIGSLAGFPGQYVLVAGGRHKGAPYTPLRQVLLGKARALMLIGEAADLIAADLSGVTPIHRAETITDAVEQAWALAEPGEAVVLSPACSSYDMFDNYEVRGHAFAAAVAELARRHQ